VTTPLVDAVNQLVEGHDLSTDQADHAVTSLLSGVASDVEAAAFLTALRAKGETRDELAGAVRAVRRRGAPSGLDLPAAGVLDTCGTGGDGARSVNVSTAAAIVVAACGVPVVKHGNRSASGNSGSSDVLTELGVAIEPGPGVANRCLAELGITFLFAPRFHPGLRQVAAVRRLLPFRTIFNLVGPLANPARPRYQLIGVPDLHLARLMAGASASLQDAGGRAAIVTGAGGDEAEQWRFRVTHGGRAAIVTGADGLDEVSLGGTTETLVVESGAVKEVQWSPATFGLSVVAADSLRVDGPSQSARRIRKFLAGEPGPVRSTVLANAAAALWTVAGGSLTDLVDRAADAVDRGRAGRLLDDWSRLSHSGDDPSP